MVHKNYAPLPAATVSCFKNVENVSSQEEKNPTKTPEDDDTSQPGPTQRVHTRKEWDRVGGKPLGKRTGANTTQKARGLKNGEGEKDCIPFGEPFK